MIPGMKLLDRYIANEFWQPLLFGIGIVTGVWFGAEQLKTIFNLVMRSGVPLQTALTILGLHLPEVIVMTIPIGVLLGTLLVFNRLSGDSEIIALRTTGVSFYRIMVAPLMFGLMTSLASFCVNEFIVPNASVTSKKLEFYAMYHAALQSGQANFTYMERKKDLTLDRVFYVGYYSGRDLADIIILDFTRPKMTQIIMANYGKFLNGEWLLNKGRTYVLDPTSDLARIVKFETLKIPGLNKVQKTLDTGIIAPKEMNMFQLGQHLENLKAGNSLPNDLLVRYYQKVAQPLACLIVALAGAPLGLMARRSRSNLGLIYSAVVVFLYYVLQSTSGAMGDAGRIPPMLAAWLPNICIGTLGMIILYFKAK